MQVGQAGVDLIKRNEGCRLTAYRDAVNVLTIGYGHTEGVTEGQTITQAEAEQMLADDLNKNYGPQVEAALGGAPTTQAQFDAMVSLAYNVGVAGFARSHVCQFHKAGNYTAAADAFAMWNKAGGRALAGLTRRRIEEEKLYLSDLPHAAGRAPAQEQPPMPPLPQLPGGFVTPILPPPQPQSWLAWAKSLIGLG